ncbi:MAG: hypothetical protein ACRDOS_16080 [Gaiellaceae bacterium]
MRARRLDGSKPRRASAAVQRSRREGGLAGGCIVGHTVVGIIVVVVVIVVVT